MKLLKSPAGRCLALVPLLVTVAITRALVPLLVAVAVAGPLLAVLVAGLVTLLVAVLILWPGSVTMMLDDGPKVDPSKIQITIPTLDTGVGGIGPSPFGGPPPVFETPPTPK